MRTIHFKDDGQDFTQWDISAKGEVVACCPFQGWVWVGTKVHNENIKAGTQLDITTKDGIRRKLSHLVARITKS